MSILTDTPSSNTGIDPPVVIEDFVIEAYDKQQEIPHITVLENTRKSTRHAGKDRTDSATICRSCGLSCNSVNLSPPCYNCYAVYHMKCVYSKSRRNFEQGKWLCSNCATKNDFNENLRANAVIKLRRMYEELHQRPCLPLKMQYKYTDIPFISLKPSRVSSDHATSDKSEKSQQATAPIHIEQLPYKCRTKVAVNRALEEEESRKRPRPNSMPKGTSKQDVDSARRKRCRVVTSMADELIPYINDSDLIKRLETVQKKISGFLERTETVIGKTKVSQNQMFTCKKVKCEKEEFCKQEVKGECLVTAADPVEGNTTKDAHSYSNDIGSTRYESGNKPR